jgi:cardiolipin synthase
VSDRLARALDRASGARPIPGNALRHIPDSAAALDAMLGLISGAGETVHFENYIIRDDRTGRRFADALAERARAGVRVRVLYDALGSVGTGRRFWRALRRAGVDVRAFRPLLTSGPFEVMSRDHRKLVVADGAEAMLGGLCIGDEWAGDREHGRLPWRDTMVRVCGPAVAALDSSFARVWARAGTRLPDDEFAPSPEPCGTSVVRVVDGEPGLSRAYRAVQLLAAAVTERLWITDAYLVAPPPLYASLVDAAKSGVDVRLLLPGTSDIPIVRTFTRIGYRDLLRAGARIFEYRGPMLHAKTTVADREWARVGSTNLNVSSLLGNYELDIVADCDSLSEALAKQFRHDQAQSREIVLLERRRLPARLVRVPPPAPGSPEPVAAPPAHKRSRRELRAAAVVALVQVAGGARRMLAGAAASVLALAGTLLILFPTIAGAVLAAAAFGTALGFAGYALARRRRRRQADGA